MSLFASMRTAVSGMNAQASRLAAVSDNVANVNTTGYKQATAEFETVLGQQATQEYMSGGVAAQIRQDANSQGTLRGTTNVTDLAVSGNGFFVVRNDAGASYLTRAGSFVPDAQGNLVNTAGYKLMGYPMGDTVASGVAGLGGTTTVNIGQLALTAKPSTTGTFTANLPSTADITPAASLPSANVAGSTTSGKSSIVAYDNLGAPVTLDVYFNKTSDNTWQVAVFNSADAAAGGGFPYSSSALTTSTLSFDSTTGGLSSATSIDVAVPNGGSLNIDLSKSSQLAAGYAVIDSSMNGNAPSAVQRVEIDDQGTMYAVYDSQTKVATYKIPLANVRSPDNLTQITGNVFSTSSDSGSAVISDAKTGGLGKIMSSSLEDSTVDLATELTTMIESQRGYSANSKVFQTSADLVDVLVNLK